MDIKAAAISTLISSGIATSVTILINRGFNPTIQTIK